MTDIEISKALALAIGWTEENLCIDPETMELSAWVQFYDRGGFWRTFDYRDWAVAAPVAERYDCFPAWMSTGSWMTATRCGSVGEADTPQKAIAWAVIGSVK